MQALCVSVGVVGQDWTCSVYNSLHVFMQVYMFMCAHAYMCVCMHVYVIIKLFFSFMYLYHIYS